MNSRKYKQLEIGFDDIPNRLRQLLDPDEIYQNADESLLVALEEDRRIERKVAGFSGESLGPYFSMWANTTPEGGIIVSGQRDSSNGGGFEGCSKLSPQMLNRLELCGHNYCGDAKYESRRVCVKNLKGDDDFVVLFRVFYNPTTVVRTTNGKIFRRIADKCIEVKSPEEIRELQADKGEISFEKQPCGLNWPEDFDFQEVVMFSETVKSRRRLSEKLSTSELLVNRRLGTQASGKFIPNIACALLFAKDPQLVSPGCKVRFQRFAGDKENTGENYNAVKDEILEGTVPSLIAQVATVLESQLRTFSPLVPDGKFQAVPEYPRLAWYEAVVNACAHRSYGNGLRNMPVFVKMFNDRLEIESPGPFPPTVTKHNIYDTHSPRNPCLMDALFYLEYVKCAHEGTRRIRDTMRAMRLPEPEFTQQSEYHRTVKVVLWNEIKKRVPSVALDDGGGFPSQGGGLRRGVAEEDGGFNKEEQETQEVFADIPDEIKARLPVIGARAKKEDIRKFILEVCAWKPLMPQEIATYLDRKNVKKLVEAHISPMFYEGVLQRTIPETPSHPGQKYETSTKGLAETI